LLTSEQRHPERGCDPEPEALSQTLKRVAQCNTTFARAFGTGRTFGCAFFKAALTVRGSTMKHFFTPIRRRQHRPALPGCVYANN